MDNAAGQALAAGGWNRLPSARRGSDSLTRLAYCAAGSPWGCWMSVRVTSALVAGVAMTVAGCSPAPPKARYPIALSEALARLDKADITGFRNARACGMLIHFSAWHRDSHSVSWIVKSSGQEVASFEVSLSPAEGGVDAAIMVPEGANGAEIYDGEQDYSHPAMMQPLRPALRELVDAAMERRPYDWHRLPDPLYTDGLCSSLRQNFEASGQPYVLGDPKGMTHEAAARAGLSKY